MKSIILISLFFVFGFFRTGFYQDTHKPEFDSILNSKIEKVFLIDDEPEQKGWHTKLILKTKNSHNKFIL